MDAAGRIACELGCAELGASIADGLFHGVDTLKVRQHVTPAYTARRALAEAGGGLRGVSETLSCSEVRQRVGCHAQSLPRAQVAPGAVRLR